jgi:hypothetical protein
MKRKEINEIVTSIIYHQIFDMMKKSDSEIKSLFDGSFLDDEGYEVEYTSTPYIKEKLSIEYIKYLSSILEKIK